MLTKARLPLVWCTASLLLLFLLLSCKGGEEEKPAAEITATSGGPTFSRPAKLTVGWVPVMYMLQLAAADEKNWLRDELGVQVEYVRFTSGAPLLQAMAAGQIDIGYIGSGPALTAAHQRVPVKVVAANNRDAYAFVASNKFADIYARNPSTAAFSEYQKQEGHRLRIATLPRGTTPDVFVRYWLAGLGLDPEKDVEIVPMGEDKIAGALVAGQVDATAIGEPVITLVLSGDAKFRVVWWSEQILSNQISTVVLVKQSLIDQYPEMIEKLVEIHARANKLLQDDKEFWARTAVKWVGEETLPLEVARRAIQSRALNLVSNPRAVSDSILLYDRFLVQDHTFPAGITIEDLFDFRFYDRVAQKHPELKD